MTITDEENYDEDEQLLISVVTLTIELLLIMVEPLHCIKGPHLVWWDRCNKCVSNESYADGDGDGDGDHH